MLQLNTSRPAYPVARPISNGRKAGVVQFGLLRPQELQSYQDVIGEFAEIKKYGTDLHRNYLQLPETAKRQIEEMLSAIQANEIKNMNDKHQLGPIEESGDTCLELLANLALERKLFTMENVSTWKTQLLDRASLPIDQSKGIAPFSFEDFSAFKGQISNSFATKDIEWCTKLLGGNEKQARNFLGIIGAKFALFEAYEAGFDLRKSNKALLQGEAKELNEHLSVWSPDRLKIWFLAWSYTNLPPMLRFASPEYFMGQLVNSVSKQLQFPSLKLDDLLEPLQKKQFRRQELDFERHNLYPDKKDRKGLVKGFEIIGEAETLKKVEQRERLLSIQA
jgi:hypothetical protein